MVIIDTSVWLFALKKKHHTVIKDKVNNVLIESEVAINGIIKLELLGGAKTKKEYERLKNRLDALYYIEATWLLWDHASKIAFDLRRKGITVPFTDVFIASSAITENALLIHADSHFDLIAKHSDLNVESLLSIIKKKI
ncbi:MAG: nucleic acid-binding protein contains PIN domain protein [Candidatus Scalindua rubra]|uniref:Nucleic acid-binding protein contains PIN domain protein n=1 Tax=Candidatus Scalindua rubra TaxID=1872076 RepID=A0A1E3XG87_9BACT|nr:MAG: nucleic acid-binding protein contains PIN domain protein [Candidatus Scalindua rubra]